MITVTLQANGSKKGHIVTQSCCPNVARRPPPASGHATSLGKLQLLLDANTMGTNPTCCLLLSQPQPTYLSYLAKPRPGFLAGEHSHTSLVVTGATQLRRWAGTCHRHPLLGSELHSLPHTPQQHKREGQKGHGGGPGCRPRPKQSAREVPGPLPPDRATGSLTSARRPCRRAERCP